MTRDLIDRAAVREALREVNAWTMPIARAIAALPAVTVLTTNPVDDSQTPNPVVNDPAAHVNKTPKIEHDAGNVLTDPALIDRLREIQGQAGLFASVAADRIEALVKERDEALEWLSASQGYIADAVFALDKQEKAEARAERLEAALRVAHDTLWEINPNNYDHDEVCRLNDACVEVILGIAPLIGEMHGKSPEWWEARAALSRALTQKGGDAFDKNPIDARPATSPGVTAGAIREAALWEAADLCFKNSDGITEAVSASPQIKKRRVLLQRAEQSKVDAAAILALIQKGAADDRTDPMQELIDAYEDIMDYGIVFAKREQQERLKAAKEALK